MPDAWRHTLGLDTAGLRAYGRLRARGVGHGHAVKTARRTVTLGHTWAAIELVGPHGYEHNWIFVGVPADKVGHVTTLKGDQQFYHVTRRDPEQAIRNGLPPSQAGESGPGVYLAADRQYASSMTRWDNSMKTLGVTVHAGNGLHLLDRTKPGGEAEYRRIQMYENGNKNVGMDKALAANGYHGVRYLSPGNKYAETVIHDPGKLTVHGVVSPGAA